ncbi:uncharacterized protein LOC129885215 isoform X2 [Solanum dulcamara]|uniref:uncharacterized protein LOC129885215 isoform X2 n=1 Tax=Solanum dulcamara TaxID=45834 RepID=UPI002485BBC4|nr:uncharacterized protein LOC129885215 isoform X2 [Solanum dulcamara]
MGDLHSIAYNGFSSLGCDFNGLEVFNNDMSPFIESTPPFLSNLDCDLSSGYLQDALFKFSSKRRRLLLFNDDDEKENYQNKDSNNSIKNLWSSTIDQQFSEDYDSFSQITKCDSFSGGGDQKRSKKRMSGKIVYPFGLVKPGGKEGDVTLNDINERILMRPTRPVRHPVGDFACRPTVCPAGPGLSGKTVVALTKIHTQGRGTITIIRTRG